jgi:hypothetical protein
MNDLRTTLHRLADATEPLPVDDGLWQRAQAARRRGQVLVAAAVLAIIASVTWSAVLLGGDDGREARTASQEVPGGAIPSRIDFAPSDVTYESTIPRGRASVAYVSGGGITLIGADDGTYHLYASDDPGLGLTRRSILALSPDGLRLAWTATDGIGLADLETGDVVVFAHDDGSGATVSELVWEADSQHVLWNGRHDGSFVGGDIDVTDPSAPSELTGDEQRFGTRGIPSPSNDMVALPSDGEVAAAAFLSSPAAGPDDRRIEIDRPLPTDLYPAGAVVTPMGWASEDLLVAAIDPPPSDVTEHPRLAIFTSPDRPEVEWTWREFLPRLPPVESLSIAVDLVPDLNGDPDQPLTHDFTASPPTQQRDVSWIIGLGVAAAIAVLLGLRWLLRRLLG